MIKALSYIVVETPHLDAWATQARDHIGMLVEEVIAVYWRSVKFWKIFWVVFQAHKQIPPKNQFY